MLPARLSLQLHKFILGADEEGRLICATRRNASLLVQRHAENTPGFFEIKGTGTGIMPTNTFMDTFESRQDDYMVRPYMKAMRSRC